MHHARAKRRRRKHLAGPTLVPWTARGGSRLRPVPRGKYGIVRITRGRYEGHLAYYDDDEVQGTSIVYPWGSVPAGYVVVRHSSLAEATPAEARLWEEEPLRAKDREEPLREARLGRLNRPPRV